MAALRNPHTTASLLPTTMAMPAKISVVTNVIVRNSSRSSRLARRKDRGLFLGMCLFLIQNSGGFIALCDSTIAGFLESGEN